MTKARFNIAAFALTAFALTAPLHAGRALAEDVHSQHGGKVVESGHHHVEIVAKDGAIEVYVNGEDGKPEDIAGAKASAAVLSEGKKHDVTLAAGAGNFLTGSGDFKAAKGTTIVVTLTMPGHEPEQSRIKLD